MKVSEFAQMVIRKSKAEKRFFRCRPESGRCRRVFFFLEMNPLQVL
jgi:hypothetical protein